MIIIVMMTIVQENSIVINYISLNSYTSNHLCLYICMYVCEYVRVFFLSIELSTYCTYLFVFQSIHQSMYVSIYLSVRLTIFSIYLYTYILSMNPDTISCLSLLSICILSPNIKTFNFL